MGIKVEIIEDNLVLFPESSVEKYALECLFSNIQGESTDPTSISERIKIDPELMLERDY